LQTVRPTPLRVVTSTPSTVTVHVTSCPIFTMVTFGVLLPVSGRLTSFVHGNPTLNSVCIIPSLST
jgi:hypothetical protein